MTIHKVQFNLSLRWKFSRISIFPIHICCCYFFPLRVVFESCGVAYRVSWHLTWGVGDFVLEGLWSHHHPLKSPLSYLRGPAGEAKLTQVPFSQSYKTAFSQDALALLSWYTDLTLRCRKTRCFPWTGGAVGKRMGSLGSTAPALRAVTPPASRQRGSHLTVKKLISSCTAPAPRASPTVGWDFSKFMCTHITQGHDKIKITVWYGWEGDHFATPK